MKCQPKVAFWVLAGAAVALMGGCSSEPDSIATEQERSVEWYLAHPAELNAKVRECAATAAAVSAADGNCARAFQAGLRDQPSK